MSYANILAPIAPGHGPEADRAVEVARSLLTPDGRITVQCVIEQMSGNLGLEAAMTYPAIVEANAAQAKEVEEHFTAEDVTVEIDHGHPTRAILHRASEQGHDCIVIPSAHSGWGSYFIGSTASGVVRHAHCSVLVIRGPA